MPILENLLASRSIRRRQTPVSALSALLAPALIPAPALPAHAEPCRLALVLGVDGSSSVSAMEDRQQREGLAAALLAPGVTRAFLMGEPVALCAFEWAATSSQAALFPDWEMIESENDLLGVATLIGQSRRTPVRSSGFSEDGTAVGAALVHAATALAPGPHCQGRTVDVPGDGVNSQGVEPGVVLGSTYDGITVNALVIDEPVEDPLLHVRYGRDAQLATWFIDEVLHGPAAFLISADGYDDFERAMTAMLIRELEVPLVGEAPTGRPSGSRGFISTGQGLRRPSQGVPSRQR